MEFGIATLKKFFGKQNEETKNEGFWLVKPNISHDVTYHVTSLKGKELYDFQIEKLTNYLLVNDTSPMLNITKYPAKKAITAFKWINKGEVVAGSFMAATICESLGYDKPQADDIDIYFKSKEDAELFCNINSISNGNFSEKQTVCAYATHNEMRFNLIWGIAYQSAEDLISRFDIRACSIAFDPNTHLIYYVEDAINDVLFRKIVFNPVPMLTSINRLIKYVQKGFEIEAYQRLFFSELIRHDLYSANLELTTGYGSIISP